MRFAWEAATGESGAAPGLIGHYERPCLGQAVDLHLVVLVLAKGADDGFDELTYRIDGRALPDANAYRVIVCGGMDRERDAIRQPGGDRLVLCLHERLGIRDAVDDADVHMELLETVTQVEPTYRTPAYGRRATHAAAFDETGERIAGRAALLLRATSRSVASVPPCGLSGRLRCGREAVVLYGSRSTHCPTAPRKNEAVISPRYVKKASGRRNVRWCDADDVNNVVGVDPDRILVGVEEPE